MIGKAVETSPDIAKEIVRRGHEAAAHGRTWQNSYFLDPDAERRVKPRKAAAARHLTIAPRPPRLGALTERRFRPKVGKPKTTLCVTEPLCWRRQITSEQRHLIVSKSFVGGRRKSVVGLCGLRRLTLEFVASLLGTTC
jgi:hypothetical protein